MATFEAQVEALTGISIDGSSNPTQTELSQFLVDGVVDVVNKMTLLRPEEIHKFTDTTNSTTNVTRTGQILSVVREHDSTSILRPCVRINPNDRYEATDSDSLKYRSKYSPGFYEIDELIHTVPAAGSGDNDIVVTQVAYDTGLVYGDTAGAIANFPTEYEYLVSLYAAIQSLQAAMANNVISLSISSPTAPVMTVISFTSTDLTYNTSVPSVLSASILNSPGVTSTSKADISGDVPTYTKPVRSSSSPFSDFTSGLSETDPGTLTISATTPISPADPSFSTPGVGTVTIATFGAAPTFVPPSTSQVTTYIETNQDVELASAKLQEINTNMQFALNTFNEKNVAYQAEVQQNIQQAQIDAQEAQAETSLLLQKENQEYVAKLQKYSAEVGTYQSDVEKEVQEYQTKLSQYTTELGVSVQAWQQEESTKIAQYQADIQNELNEFNKENARYQANIQAEITKAQLDAQEYQAEGDMTLQASVQEYTNNLQKYQGDIARYSASVTADVQEFQQELASDVQSYQADVQDNNAKIAKYQAEVTDYQAEVAKEIQENTTKTQQYQNLYVQLFQQYNAAFQIAQPQQQGER